MRAVIDTNVLLAGLLWHGPPHGLLTHVRSGSLGLISSPALLAELGEVLGRSKFDTILKRSNTSREKALAEVRQLAEAIEPPPLPQPGGMGSGLESCRFDAYGRTGRKVQDLTPSSRGCSALRMGSGLESCRLAPAAGSDAKFEA